DVVVALAQRFKQQPGRAHTGDVNALRGEEQLDGLENVGLIVGHQNTNSLLLTWNCLPPRRRILRQRSKSRNSREWIQWRGEPRCAPFRRRSVRSPTPDRPNSDRVRRRGSAD